MDTCPNVHITLGDIFDHVLSNIKTSAKDGDLIERLEQSNSDMTFEGDMLVKFTHVIPLKGMIICARALAVARAYVDNDPI
uniref:Uncharacterized protein n=1 Tax=Romanomermis culicivorax TaxID=13658 RepID=A0A915HNW5_ROMCU